MTVPAKPVAPLLAEGRWLWRRLYVFATSAAGGLLLAQDDDNPGGTNFKISRFADIAAALKLTIGTPQDPRALPPSDWLTAVMLPLAERPPQPSSRSVHRRSSGRSIRQLYWRPARARTHRPETPSGACQTRSSPPDAQPPRRQ
jgi:hypothetical protein